MRSGDAGETAGLAKKKINKECGLLAVGGATDDPYLAACLRAHKVYTVTGQPIWPWDVDRLVTPDWMIAIQGITDEIPKRTPKG